MPFTFFRALSEEKAALRSLSLSFSKGSRVSHFDLVLTCAQTHQAVILDSGFLSAESKTK